MGSDGLLVLRSRHQATLVPALDYGESRLMTPRLSSLSPAVSSPQSHRDELQKRLSRIMSYLFKTTQNQIQIPFCWGFESNNVASSLAPAPAQNQLGNEPRTEADRYPGTVRVYYRREGCGRPRPASAARAGVGLGHTCAFSLLGSRPLTTPRGLLGASPSAPLTPR